MTPKELILIGGGGHCKACIDVIENSGEYRITGILDKKELIGSTVLGYPVIGTDDDIPRFQNTGAWFLITLGQTKSAAARIKLFAQLQAVNANMATVISERAVVSKHSSIGAGSIVMHNACVSASAVIGRNCIINTGADIEHDCVVGDHVHVSTGAVANGMCKIGDGCFIGSNSTLVQGVRIVASTVIGAGSVVLGAIDESGTYVGNPSRKIN